MLIRNARYLLSVNDPESFPRTGFPEYAFIGRSNVGKSSLINILADSKSLAKISSTPGKTKSINYFLVNDAWYLVDLPGYGWAAVSKQLKYNWNVLVRKYLLTRKELHCLFILVDCRHEPQDIDLGFINWAGRNGIPIALVFTKADKVTLQVLNKNTGRFLDSLRVDWQELPETFITSVIDRRGKAEILDYIGSIIKNIG
jgi:GTP-binding protein